MGVCTQGALFIMFIIMRIKGVVEAIEPNPWISTFEILLFAAFTTVSLITWIKLAKEKPC